MFNILEADIVVMQEAKIQRKDLQDDMVLVPGWDCYFSLPKHKKGYSGVVIYTRQSVCAPIRAEEGITGILCPPNSSTSYNELPEMQQIGGYPSSSQLASSTVDAVTLDSEGRCVMLEFPAFVLLGVYSPANRDHTRNDFRLGFLDVLDARIRNLVRQGKRVVLTGDLNISREELDTANAEESMRKSELTGDEYASTPARRLFNQLLVGGKVFGERDEGREKPVLWDICRGFHPTRKGMFTCWEQKINARPGNYGARIDYVLCSEDMKEWFCDSNIQEGLLGSDHCPVYATLKDKILLDDKEVDVRDVMNPEGIFKDGKRLRDYSMKDLPPLSGKLIPEFDRRRNIRDMFARKVSNSTAQSTESSTIPQSHDISSGAVAEPASTPSQEAVEQETTLSLPSAPTLPLQSSTGQASPAAPASPANSTSKKRSIGETSTKRSLKRSKSMSTTTSTISTGKGQQSLKGFFKPKAPATFFAERASRGDQGQAFLGSVEDRALQPATASQETTNTEGSATPASPTPVNGTGQGRNGATKQEMQANPPSLSPTTLRSYTVQDQEDVHDPVVSKESWSKLFTKPAAPRCEGHNEPCISMLTKKSGFNCGRSFWMCARPVGPTGTKERNTQWRCQTFIWCSDWNGGIT
ncbi:Class II abasic (AP) endonuclease [Acarospora aff. strigata]|nr:Class II abasic (AP) endonuclease [Acarospora aff. strigata]